VTTRAQRLATPEDDEPLLPRPRSLGAARSPTATLPQHVARICRLPATAITSNMAVATLLKAIEVPASVVVRDVGQANFISLLDKNGTTLLHFDVGFPVSFNRHTFPKNFAFITKESPIVALSHWDWDHLHGAFGLPHLLDCKWIVPSQRLGPGAARLAIILANKNNLFVWPSSFRRRFHFGWIMECNGAPGDQNDTGLSLHSKLKSGRSVLLTGDADYQFLPPACAGSVTHLVATHHGARFKSPSGAVPQPTSPASELVLSYGTRNVYQHPHVEALRVHKAAGWKGWISTAGRKGIAPRGDRTLI
jgi:hypothetical protein